jgi:hypothetical protein
VNEATPLSNTGGPDATPCAACKKEHLSGQMFHIWSKTCAILEVGLESSGRGGRTTIINLNTTNTTNTTNEGKRGGNTTISTIKRDDDSDNK